MTTATETTLQESPLPQHQSGRRDSQPSFFDSFECRSASHCIACRDLTGGADFRTSIAAYFDARIVSNNILQATHPNQPPSDSPVSWSCPHGRPWKFVGNAQPIPHHKQVHNAQPVLKVPTTPKQRPAILAGVIAECQSCGERVCPNVTVCCGGQVSVNIITPCPQGRW
ncbi:MAG: hypothetical protein EHM48_02940 [Planctomycetaceae bacterium]|nr:MAG: hypothetical protein EHM48_02940 [Planctomycetaceae bacterium]